MAYPSPPEAGIQVLATVFTVPGSPAVIYRFATNGFTTSATDTPPNTYFDGRISNEPTYRRSVSCVFWGRRRSESGIGFIDLINSDGALDALSLSDVRGVKVQMYRGTLGTPFSTWVLVVTGVVDRAEILGLSAIRLYLHDKAAILEQALQQELYGAGSNAALEGQPKPISYGTVYSCPAPQASTTLLIYDVNDRAVDSVLRVRDQGVELSGPASSPNGWQYDTDPAFHGFQLTANPAGRIVADVRGSLDGVGSPTTLVQRLPQVVQHICVTHGPLVLADLDMTSIDALDAAAPYALGNWIDAPKSCADELDDVMQSFAGWWYIDSQGLLRVGRIETTGTPLFTLGDTELVGEFGVEMDRAPGLSTLCLGQRNHYVHTDADFAGSVSETDRATLRADYRARRLSAGAIASTYAQALAGGIDGGIATLLSDAADVQTEADRYGQLFGTRRYFWSFSAAMSLADLLSLEPGQWLELTMASNRFGLLTPLPVQIIEIEFSFISNIVRFRATSAAPTSISQVTWGDGTGVTWGDGTPVEWSA